MPINHSASVTPAAIPARLNHRNLSALVADGRIFGVSFIKRSTGELRHMRARVGVKSHLRGGKKGYDAEVKNLLTVFDVDANGYRSIPLEGIQSLTINNQRFVFTGEGAQ